MQAFIFGLMIPVLPLLIRKLYHKKEELTLRQVGGRYVVYTLLATCFSTIIMTFFCDNTSFLAKMDQSPSFILKFVCIELVAAAVIAAVEWSVDRKKISITIDREGYHQLGVVRFCRKVLFPAGCFLLALLVVCLNFSLMNDNVVWGDEAYAGNAVQNSIEGIFQILTLEENHPPLYYLWLKGFGELFGYTTPVYHLASLVLFLMGIVLALGWLRRRYGNIPAAFFVIISGLATPCLEYNLEIRMYAMAFLGSAGCYYSVSRIFAGSKVAGWVGMVIWALVAAYAHYYALVAVGIMIFFTCVLAYLRFKGRVWLKGVASIAICIAAYVPWLGQVLRATSSVSKNWWMKEIESLQQCLTMIGCGESMKKIVLPLLLLLAVILFLWESSVFDIRKANQSGSMNQTAYQVNIAPPSVRNWSAETYTLAVGFLTIIGTVMFSYGISILMQPLVTGRYLYPLCAVVAMMLAVGSHGVLEKMVELGNRCHIKWLQSVGKCILLLVLAVLFVTGVGNYKEYRAVVEYEDAKTSEILSYIGEPDESTQFINNGIMHIGWTVLRYYYSDAEIINGSFEEASGDAVWYFTPGVLAEEEIQQLNGMGYDIVGNYGNVQLGKYECVLYRFARKVPSV